MRSLRTSLSRTFGLARAPRPLWLASPVSKTASSCVKIAAVRCTERRAQLTASAASSKLGNAPGDEGVSKLSETCLLKPGACDARRLSCAVDCRCSPSRDEARSLRILSSESMQLTALLGFASGSSQPCCLGGTSSPAARDQRIRTVPPLASCVGGRRSGAPPSASPGCCASDDRIVSRRASVRTNAREVKRTEKPRSEMYIGVVVSRAAPNSMPTPERVASSVSPSATCRSIEGRRASLPTSKSAPTPDCRRAELAACALARPPPAKPLPARGRARPPLRPPTPASVSDEESAQVAVCTAIPIQRGAVGSEPSTCASCA